MSYVVQIYHDHEWEHASPIFSEGNLPAAIHALADTVSEVEKGEFYAEMVRLVDFEEHALMMGVFSILETIAQVDT